MDKVLIGEILEPGDDKTTQSRFERVGRDLWKTVLRAGARVPFMDEVVASWYCALDPQTPLKARGIILAALAYFVMPADMVPDILALVGFSDDIAVLTAAFAAVRSNITPAHRAAARAALEKLRNEA